VKETLALANVLMAFGEFISNSWVDIFTDSQVLVKAWQRQGAISQAFSSALKKVFLVMSSLNIDLHLFTFQVNVIPLISTIATPLASGCQTQ
jgi:hypothetical protein